MILLFVTSVLFIGGWGENGGRIRIKGESKKYKVGPQTGFGSSFRMVTQFVIYSWFQDTIVGKGSH